MKITKRQLRRIIREEKAQVLAEQKVRRVVRNYLLTESHPVDAHLMQLKGTKGFDQLLFHTNQLTGILKGELRNTAVRFAQDVLEDEFDMRAPKGGKEAFQDLLARIPGDLKDALAKKMGVGSSSPQANNDGRTVTGTHGGKPWSVRIPDDLAAYMIDVHQTYMDGEDDNASHDLVDASYRIHNYIQREVEKQVGVAVPYQRYDSYDETGLADDLSDAMVDAASEE